jgi:hypothetical protein
MIDLEQLFYLSDWSTTLVGPVALIIGLITLVGFARFRSWKFLLLSIAFLVISISPLLQFLSYMQLLDSSLYQLYYVLQTHAMRYLLPTISFLLLAVVYTDELRTATVRIGKTGWITFGILVASYAILAIIIPFAINQLDPFRERFIIGLAPQIIDGWICFTIVLVAIASLYAHYQTKKKTNTLLTLAGFVLILLGQTGPLNLEFLYAYPNEWSWALYLILVGPITLFGFILLLAAIVKAKVSHG